MIFIGIDPGLTGAVAAILQHPRQVVLLDMPTAQTGAGAVKRQVMPGLLAAFLKRFSHGATAVVERTSARPGQGVASMFSMGVSRGVVIGVLGALSIPYVEVAPQTWKKSFGLLGKDKSASRHEALKLFPALAQDLAREKDHNRAEAVLLAHWLSVQQKEPF